MMENKMFGREINEREINGKEINLDLY